MGDFEFWHVPQNINPALINTAEKLTNVVELIEEAAVCGIDCEWPPEQTDHRPSATLLQLALWSPSHGFNVVLLDILNLDKTATADLLRRLFRRNTALKVGYSLRTDLSALASALGSHGASTVSVIDSIIDLAALHRFLSSTSTNGVHASFGGGLSGVVSANLGAPLDKSEQCSAWGDRPLTKEQLLYAATDACCLLALLQHFIHCILRTEAKHDCSTDSNVSNATNLPLENFLSWTAEEIESAAKLWAERWEYSLSSKRGGGKVHRTGGLSSQMPLEAFSSSKSSKKSASSNLDFIQNFPSHVPWMDGSKMITSSPLFITDVMLGGLAKQLRLWGWDCEAVDCVSKHERHLAHRNLVERAAQEGRVVLTRDTIFMKRNLTDQAYYVKAETKKEQLEEIISVFGLPVARETLLSRCSRCNGEFGETPVPASELAKLGEGHGVPPGVLEKIEEFWVCERCGAAYWQGNMYARAMERLGAALDELTLSGGGEMAGKKRERGGCRLDMKA